MLLGLAKLRERGAAVLRGWHGAPAGREHHPRVCVHFSVIQSKVCDHCCINLISCNPVVKCAC